MYTSKEMEERAGITRKALRVYVEKGLIKRSNDCSDYWLFDDNEYGKLTMIVLLRDLGWSLEKIATHFNKLESVNKWNDAKTEFEEIVNELEEKKRRIESQIRLIKGMNEIFALVYDMETDDTKLNMASERLFTKDRKPFSVLINEAIANPLLIEGGSYYLKLVYELDKLIGRDISGNKDDESEIMESILLLLSNIINFRKEHQGELFQDMTGEFDYANREYVVCLISTLHVLLWKSDLGGIPFLTLCQMGIAKHIENEADVKNIYDQVFEYIVDKHVKAMKASGKIEQKNECDDLPSKDNKEKNQWL